MGRKGRRKSGREDPKGQRPSDSNEEIFTLELNGLFPQLTNSITILTSDVIESLARKLSFY